jgi:hypothetical protein
MIRRIIGFSLYYGLGVGTAVLAMATLLPSLQLGHGVGTDVDSGVQHAIFVAGGVSCPAPAIADATARCPYLAAVAAGSRCPYLAAAASGTRCPYLSALSSSSSGCPYLSGAGGHATCPFLEGRRGADGDHGPQRPQPSAPGGVRPKAIQPDTDWMPEGTVLARLESVPALVPDQI